MLPTGLVPMLATAGPLPVSDDWSYEVKWDGVRLLVAVEGGQVRAHSRNRNEVTRAYPELDSLAGLPDVLLDGEIVALVDGLPSFEALQSRMHVRSPSPALLTETPVTFLPFDVLHVQDSSLLDQPYDARRSALASLDLEVPPAFDGDGAVLLESTRAQGLEGLVAKRRSSTYAPGRRSPDWIKVKHLLRPSVVVCGWKPGSGSRTGAIGSLLLGVHGPDGLVYAGHVGTGMSGATLRLLAERLAPLARPLPPYDGEVPREHARLATWVEPVLVVDVEATAWTREGRLRHPSYKGLREDLDPKDVTRGRPDGH